MTRRILYITALFVLAASTAFATPWQFPNEVSVAEVYNNTWGTSYSETTVEGLSALLADHGTLTQTTFNTSSFNFLRVEVFDTSSTAPLTVHYGAGFNDVLAIFTPGPWTPPTRGYQPGGSSFIDLAALIGTNADYRFYVGNTLLSQSNTITALGADGYLLGYNGGGFSGDSDFNEPLIHMSSTPLPAAVWLLGTGIVGLLGFRRSRA